MNKGRIVLGIALIVLSAVIFTVSSSVDFGFFGWEDDSKDQSKVTTYMDVAGIKRIKADGVVRVHINPSDSNRVRFVFNKDRFSNKSTFEDGVLRIDFSSKNRGFKLFGYSNSGVDVYVQADSLVSVRMDGVGSVKSMGVMHAEDISIVNEGNGSMKLEIEASKLNGRNSGVGSMRLNGEVDSAKLSNQGVGSLNAKGLITQVLDVRNDGVGSMEVYAEQEIELRNSGVGSIRYSGEAVVRKKISEGVGSISKR